MPRTFIVPGPPVPCERPRVVRGGKHSYLPKRSRDYQRLVRECAEPQFGGWELDPSDRYAISIYVYRARDAGDWDNFAKSITDALKGLAWDDDRRVHEAHVYLGINRTEPKVIVDVRKLPIPYVPT